MENYVILATTIVSLPATNKGYQVYVAWADGPYFRVTMRGINHWPTAEDIQYIASSCGNAPADIAKSLFPFIKRHLVQ